MVQPEPSVVWMRGRTAALDELDEYYLLADGTESGGPVASREYAQAEDPCIVVEGAGQIGNLETHLTQACLRREAIVRRTRQVCRVLRARASSQNHVGFLGIARIGCHDVDQIEGVWPRRAMRLSIASAPGPARNTAIAAD